MVTPNKFMRGSFNGKITGFHPVVKGSIPLPRTKCYHVWVPKRPKGAVCKIVVREFESHPRFQICVCSIAR